MSTLSSRPVCRHRGRRTKRWGQAGSKGASVPDLADPWARSPQCISCRRRRHATHCSHRLPTAATGCQPIPPVANRFHRLPPVANRAAGSRAVRTRRGGPRGVRGWQCPNAGHGRSAAVQSPLTGCAAPLSSHLETGAALPGAGRWAHSNLV
jgi:hypothetical protein